MNAKKILIAFAIVGVCIVIAVFIAIFSLNAYVKSASDDYIITPNEATNIKDADCIIVLGCQVKDNGEPSSMLGDRLKRGIDLYKSGAAPKIIMSGDHGQKGYDEVNTMKQVAVDAGIPSEDIFMDHAGFSTYESMYRTKEVFKADKIIIVTQEYHLYRSLYIADKLGLDAYGVSADYRAYFGQSYREVREILARCKDFVKTIFKPEPTYLGDAIPVSGNGDITNDQ